MTVFETRREHVRLPGDLTAAAVARAWLRERLSSCHSASQVEDCLVVASELVTNAVRYGGPPVELDLEWAPTCLRLVVSDPSPVLPTPVLPDNDAEGGRGLVLAVALSDSLLAEPVNGDGKRLVAQWWPD